MTERKRNITTKKLQKRNELDLPKERILTVIDVPETDEIEIQKKTTEKSPAKKVRIPKDTTKQFQLPPDEFANGQNALEAFESENREVEVYADSLESVLGYDSLMRILTKQYNSQVAYYRSAAGGCLPLEEARKAAYRRDLTDDEGLKLFDQLVRCPTEQIGLWHLLELNGYSPVMAQNLWEMIKREAAREFESGHLAAIAFEPADWMSDAWNRASYLGLRESLCEEWQPKGGIELTMIDAIAQAWLMLQHWTKESVKRAKTEPRRENHQFYEWKQWNKEASPKQWIDGHWDVPMVTEKEAVEHAAQMADRWQRMYLRAIRSLRDWRRYTPQLTINNPQQVNIANDGGQQINVAGVDENKTKKIIS